MVRSLLGAPLFAFPVAALGALTMLGCEHREAVDPSELIADEIARAAPPPRSLSRNGAHVTCRCDAEGGLHVVAPRGSTVTTSDRDAAGGVDAEADIVLADEGSSLPIRRTKSLGFIGDNKLSNDGPRYVDPRAYSLSPSSSQFGGGYGYSSRSFSSSSSSSRSRGRR